MKYNLIIVLLSLWAQNISAKNVLQGLAGESCAWDELDELVQQDLSVKLIKSSDCGEWYLWRNRADEAFRFVDFQSYDEERRNQIVKLLLAGGFRIELLSDIFRSSVTGRVFCCDVRTHVGRISSMISADDLFYRPSLFVREVPMLGVLCKCNGNSINEIASARGASSISELRKGKRSADCDLQVFTLSPGCCFRVDIEDAERSNSFTAETIIPSESMAEYRMMVDNSHKGCQLISLSPREASEMLYVLLGDKEYCRRVQSNWFATTKELSVLTTNMGRSLCRLKSNPQELSQMEKRIVEVKQKFSNR